MSKAILSNNKLITATPTLTTSSNNTNDASGLYASTATNTGEPTYYFRGNVENNYVSFAGFTWRIVRINEDGTVRLIMQDGIDDNTNYQFNSNCNNYTYMYYSNSEIRPVLENWYQRNIGEKSNIAKNIATGSYYCEQAKVKYSSDYTSGNANMTLYFSYMPDFKCTTDGNGKGQVSESVGLLSYDEVVYAGGFSFVNNDNYYLLNSNNTMWTMSPAGYAFGMSAIWFINTTGSVTNPSVSYTSTLHPVINLKTDTQNSSGNGTKNNPYLLSEN